jgi:flavin reductase (DIM6/NTAB) family NADH-FMN oxidoreductase RutF
MAAAMSQAAGRRATTRRALAPPDLRRVLSTYPTGVTAVAAVVRDRPVGIAANSFTSVSLEPPIVSISVAHTSTTWPELRTAPRLGISVLGAHQERHGRLLSARGIDRFASVKWEVTDHGAVLIDGASAWLDCSIDRLIPVGDHDLVLLTVHSLDGDVSVPPLVFHASRYLALPA